MEPLTMTDVVELVISKSFTTALFALRRAIESAGMVVFACIDHSGAAQDIGLSLPPTILLLYGNAKGGSPAMIWAPQIALDLPLRVLLRQDHDGKVLLAYHPVAPLLCAAGIPATIAERLMNAEQAVMVDASR